MGQARETRYLVPILAGVHSPFFLFAFHASSAKAANMKNMQKPETTSFVCQSSTNWKLMKAAKKNTRTKARQPLSMSGNSILKAILSILPKVRCAKYDDHHTACLCFSVSFEQITERNLFLIITIFASLCSILQHDLS